MKSMKLYDLFIEIGYFEKSTIKKILVVFNVLKSLVRGFRQSYLYPKNGGELGNTEKVYP